ncbi:hypothetical protein F01_210081 [Burkholderia cenocepacia]|nr:hypothetical protein F01_210081 [Burkholderia cenocepacia]
MVLRDSVELVARADRRSRWRGAREIGLEFAERRRAAEDDRVHLHFAAARFHPRFAVHARRVVAVFPYRAQQGRPALPPAATAVRRPVQPGPRRQRCTEDDRHHLDAADRERLRVGHRRCAAGMGDRRVLPVDGPRHAVRRLAHRAHDGPEDHEAQAGRRLLRGKRRCDHAVRRVVPRHSRVDHAHDYRRDRRCRRDAEVVGRALGRRRQYRVGVGADAAGGRAVRGRRMVARAPDLLIVDAFRLTRNAPQAERLRRIFFWGRGRGGRRSGGGWQMPPTS